MHTPASIIRRFLAEDDGATAIEYGIICGMIAVVIISIAATGGAVDIMYQKLSNVVGALGGSTDSGGGG